MCDDEKKIIISGQHNRRNIKKACKVEKKKIKNNSVPVVSHHIQRNNINQIFIGDDFEHKKLYESEIIKKINGYKQQDKRKGVFNPNELITFDECIEKIMVSKLSCYYCKSNIYILYNNNLEQKQWTLDRINNDLCHSCVNVVICCLKCNIQRKNMDSEKFEFTKSLKLIKTND